MIVQNFSYPTKHQTHRNREMYEYFLNLLIESRFTQKVLLHKVLNGTLLFHVTFHISFIIIPFKRTLKALYLIVIIYYNEKVSQTLVSILIHNLPISSVGENTFKRGHYAKIEAPLLLPCPSRFSRFF